MWLLLYKVERVNKNQSFCYCSPYFLSEFAVITDLSCYKPDCIGIEIRKSGYNLIRSNFSCSRNTIKHLPCSQSRLEIAVPLIILCVYTFIREILLGRRGTTAIVRYQTAKRKIPYKGFLQTNQSKDQRDDGKDVCGYGIKL